MADPHDATPAATIREPGRALPVKHSCDVLVAGGGLAGSAAAVAAARNGARVVLIDKACALGGLATLGIVTIWLPLCDGRGRQVSGGPGSLCHWIASGQRLVAGDKLHLRKSGYELIAREFTRAIVP